MSLNEFETEIVGIPLAPIMYWNNFHFWYWWGRPDDGEIELTDKTWIERGETIMTLRQMKIPSPFSGQVVKKPSGPPYFSEPGYDSINVSEHYVCGPCFQMKIQKAAYSESIGYIYENVSDYIIEEVRKYGPGTVGGAINILTRKIFGNHLDPKNRFDSHEEFLIKARDLLNVKAVKLTGSQG